MFTAYLTPAERKYDRGDNACGKCMNGTHKDCRPKLDGTMCSCSCPASANMREEYHARCSASRSLGKPKPTVEEVAKVFRPRYKKVFKKD